MHTSTIAPTEPQRLAALAALRILDTAPEERFDHITDLARRIFGVPMAAITLIDAHHQWIKSGAGIEAGLQFPRQETFCHYTIGHDTTMVVADALTDPRFHDIPLVRDEPKIRFYAGHPLHAPTGERVGSLCLADIMVHGFTTDQRDILAGLARLVEQEIARTPRLHRPAPARRPVSATVPEVEGWQLAGRCPPARQAQGGFYDWYVDADHLHLRCADVIGTPLDVSETSTWVEALLPTGARTGALHRSPQDHSPRPGGPGPGGAGPGAAGAGFLTAFAGSLSRDSGHLNYVHPGHGLALILQPDGRHRRLKSTGAPMGIPPQTTEPQVATTTLAPGEVLLVLSDGFLDLQAPRRAADRTLTDIRRRYPQRLSAHDALDIATDWAATQDHPHDITALAVGRTRDDNGDADTPILEVRRGIGRIQQVQWAPRLQARSLGI